MSLAIALGFQMGGSIWLLIIWALLMGISRFFGELHHPTDILAGFAVGFGTGFLIQVGYSLSL
jgi:membrane-associated phospholipid phosphatase